MATERSLNPLGGATVDRAPLLDRRDGGIDEFLQATLSAAARSFRRASIRLMRQESTTVAQETAAQHLVNRLFDWAYSPPVMFVDIMWNSMFVGLVAGILAVSWKESPALPLRPWVVGYVVRCLLHVVCVGMECGRRTLEREDGERNGSRGSLLGDVENPSGYSSDRIRDEETISFAMYVESANASFSFVWWIIGFYLVAVGSQSLARESSQLYWLCIILLAADVFIVVFCIAIACAIGICLCCWLPSILAVLYAAADPEGASDENICQIPKYKFQEIVSKQHFGSIMTECDTDQPIEFVLSPEAAVCSICLCAFEDGVELHGLPCGHYFHCACIHKWPSTSATCGLCKSSITNNNYGREEVQ